MDWAHARKFFRDLFKMEFPAWQLFLKTLPQKFWTQYLGNYTDSMVQKVGPTGI